jgi:hypothetical protein
MDLNVVETIHGTWFYHIRDGDRGPAICGYKDVMPTHVPLDAAWGYRGHLNERYCEECERLWRGMLDGTKEG